MPEDLSIFKEVGIGLGALVIFLYMVKYFLAAQKEQREDFCLLMSNHIEHNTAAIIKLDETLEKNTQVLTQISVRLEK